MSRDSVEARELEFLQAVLKRGFVTIPRMLFDYSGDLGIDYDTIGRIFILLACVGGPTESSFGPYVLSRKANAHDFNQLGSLVRDLEQKDLIRSEEVGEQLTFTFMPLFHKLKAIWLHYCDQLEEELAAGVADPALLAAEKLMGRPLSDREAADIQDWMDTYGYDLTMVQVIIREGQSQGVTRMNYLNQIAREWFQEGVRTPEDAEELAQRRRKGAGKHKAIIQYLGLKRQLTGAEQTLLDKWTEEWGFSNEVIILACTEATGVRNPLQYVNRILESWREQGVRTVADAEKILVEYKRRQPAAGEQGKAARPRKPTGNSSVFLQREKKDDSYYDHIFKKLRE